ncbi:MAG: DUF1893 domain-containing protein [Candidatus Zixiibacteriota bacterium]
MKEITQEDVQSLEGFRKDDWDLKILSGSQVIFQSDEEGIAPVVNFLKTIRRDLRDFVIFDRIVGRAVALLFIYLSKDLSSEGRRVSKVLGVTGSERAEEVLKKHEIPFHFLKTVPYIANRKKTGPCPFEELSEGKTPEEFWKIASEKC